MSSLPQYLAATVGNLPAFVIDVLMQLSVDLFELGKIVLSALELIG